MNKDELKKRLELITSPTKQRNEIYSLLTQLGISFRKTRCNKCIKDYYNILLEEANMIDSAAEVSDFDSSECSSYKYIKNRSYNWNYNGKRVLICPRTPINLIKEFVKTHKGYFVCK